MVILGSGSFFTESDFLFKLPSTVDILCLVMAGRIPWTNRFFQPDRVFKSIKKKKKERNAGLKNLRPIGRMHDTEIHGKGIDFQKVTCIVEQSKPFGWRLIFRREIQSELEKAPKQRNTQKTKTLLRR